METVAVNGENALAELFSDDDELFELTPEEIEESGQRYMNAFFENEQEERIRRAAAMQDASWIVFT
ncbi:hypothetical protein FACS1894200_12220 [Spirochaetia bacterium]|nr:hypothetical protein FACS1894200_12220 [Spirochaetia bacterium]